MSTADAPVVIPVPSPRFDSLAVLWREVNPGLWVARVQGDIIGSVEVVRSFIATDARGDVVGSFTTSDDAKSAVAQRLALWFLVVAELIVGLSRSGV